MKQLLHYFIILMISIVAIIAIPSNNLYSQANITDPNQAEPPDVSLCSNEATLVVRMFFSADQAVDSIVLPIPAGLAYVDGSVMYISGNNITAITQDANTTSSNAVFTITPDMVNTGDIVRFSIEVKADCSNTPSTVDVPVDLYSDGGASPVSSGVVSVDVIEPLLSISSDASNSLILGEMECYDIKIANGGEGSLDSIVFAIVESGAVTTTSLTVNGNPVTVDRTSGDTLFYELNSTDLGGTIPSNTGMINIERCITASECAVNGDDDRYLFIFGCAGGDECIQDESISTQFIVESEQAIKEATVTYVQSSNKCDQLILDVCYFNLGMGETAAMFDINNIRMAFGASIGQWDMKEFSVAQVDVLAPDGTISTSSVSYTGGANNTSPRPLTISAQQFTTDPDGDPDRGLSDLDMDGVYDDLAAGDTICFRYYMDYNCNLTCDDAENEISNNFRPFVQGDVDACGQSISPQNALVAFDRYERGQAPASPSAFPPLIFEGNAGSAQILVDFDSPDPNGGTNGNPTVADQGPLDCATNEHYVEITVPAPFQLNGVNVAGTPDATNTYPVAGGNTITLPNIGINGVNTLDLDIELPLGACPTPAVPAIFEIKVFYVCDDACGCVEERGCTEFSIIPDCPGPCPEGGMIVLNQSVTRTTIGYTDATASTQVDPSTLPLINLSRSQACDTVKLSITGRQIIGTVITDPAQNAYVEFRYRQLGGADNFQWLPGTAIVTGRDASTMTTVGPVSLDATDIVCDETQGTDHVVIMDMTDVLAQFATNGLSMDDSLTFCINGIVLDGDYGSDPQQIVDFTVRMFNTELGEDPKVNANQEACNFQAVEHYVRRPLGEVENVSQISARNCSNARTFNFYSRSLGDPGIAIDYFQGEVRPSYYLDSVVFDLPPGLEYDSNINPILTVRGTSDDPNYNYQLNPMPTIIRGTAETGQTLVFTNPGNWPLGDETGNGQAIFSLRINYLRTCSYDDTFDDGSYSFHVRRNFNSGDRDCAPEYISSDNFTVDGPGSNIYNFRNNTGIVTVDSKIECFEIEIQEVTSSLNNDGYLWVSFDEVNSDGFTVESVTNITGGVDTALTLLPYADGVWVQLDETVSNNEAYFLEVCVSLTDCIDGMLTIFSDTDCRGYPSDPSGLDASCSPQETDITVQQLNSGIQLNFTSQPANPVTLCQPLNYEFTVNSGLAADVVDPQVAAVLPEGLILNSTTAMIEYPIGSGNIENIPITQSNDTILINLGDHTAIMDTLPGLNNANPTTFTGGEDRQAAVKIEFVTNCDFTNGSRIPFIVFGDKPCGDPAQGNGRRRRTNRIRANLPGASLEADINLTIDSILDCNTSMATIDITLNDIVNDGMDVTIDPNTDSLRIRIENGASIDPSSYMCTGTNCPTFVASSAMGGFTELVFDLPSGIVIPDGGSVNLPTIMFDVTADPSASCEQISNLEILLTSESSGVSCFTEPTDICPNPVLSITGSADQDLVVNKILVNDLTIDTQIPGAFQGTFNIGKTALPAGESLIIEAFCSNQTTFVGSTTINGPIAANTTGITYSIPYTEGTCPNELGFVKISPMTSSNTGNMSQCVCVEAIAPDEVLPIELSYFKGYPKDCVNELQWATSSELDNAYFEIEYSEDGKNFIAVERILGAGTSLNPQYYSFTHEFAFSSLLYYRLKQVDFDGKYSFSQVIVINQNCKGIEALEAYPIPVGQTQQLQVRYFSKQSSTSLHILDIRGSILHEIKVENGWNTLQIDMSTLSNGVYYLVSKYGEAKRFVVIEE